MGGLLEKIVMTIVTVLLNFLFNKIKETLDEAAAKKEQARIMGRLIFKLHKSETKDEKVAAIESIASNSF